VALREQNSSASKMLDLLKDVGKWRRRPFGVTELALEAGLSKTTTHRMLQVLEEHGFVARAGSKYEVGPAWLDIEQVTFDWAYGDLRQVADTSLAALFERSRAVAAHLAVLRGDDVFYVEKLTLPAGTALPSRVGKRVPAGYTALGKAMLGHGERSRVEALGPARDAAYPRSWGRDFAAELCQVREDGYAVDRGQACRGFTCVAAPVLHAGRPVAAVSVTVPTSVVERHRQLIRHLGGLTRETAVQVGRRFALVVPESPREAAV
jgi:DNA-binding IclR family transcriptional regulator